ncbi:conserved exported hypothetical protein [Acidobacteriia bacterium SbA2]|nr:conserved exported hypothetical protein [Acidobacteriia bacterium SbA2]
MVNCRFDSSGFCTFLALLSTFVALPARVAGQQDSMIHRPLPDIKQLLSDVQENQKQLESLVDQYSCTEDEDVRELDKNGQIKKTIVKEYMDFYLGGELVRREVKKDGKPLTPDEQKKEDGRIEKRIRDYDKKKSEGDDASKKKERIDVSTFLRSSNFTHPRWEQFRAHEVIVFDFAPNPAYKPRNKTEDLLHKLEGALWVDDRDRQVVRLEAHLSDSFKLAGGLLASIRKGSSLVMEQARTNNEVWLPSYVEAHFSARLLLVSSSLGDYTSKFSDYKKFRVETVTGKQAK